MLFLRHAWVDVVFDQCKPDSLKAYARSLRGAGSRRKVTPTGKMPKNWPAFLQNDDNKSQLSPLLANTTLNIQNSRVYATRNWTTVCKQITRQTLLCANEEAESRIFVYLKHVTEHHYISAACILSNDNDIIIVALSFLTSGSFLDCSYFGSLLELIHNSSKSVEHQYAKDFLSRSRWLSYYVSLQRKWENRKVISSDIEYFYDASETYYTVLICK